MAYTSGIRRERSRRRRQLLWRATLLLLGLAALGALGRTAYQTGTMLAETRVTELDRRIVDLSAQLEGTRGENTSLRAGLAEARQSLQALQTRYDNDVPKGDLAELLGLAKERLGQAIPAARLAQVLREAGPTRACESRVIRKRFAIQAPGRPEEAVSFLDGLVQVSANAPNADPVRSAVVTVGRAWASAPLQLTGLPARQDIAINNVVLHLTVEVSDVAGYATATLSVCGKG